jgi:hypothetical protein
MLETTNPALGRTSKPGLELQTQSHLTARLARTKAALVHAYHSRDFHFHEAEAIAAYMRQGYSQAWEAA